MPLRFRTNGGGKFEGDGYGDAMRMKSAIYIFDDAQGHGLSRGNGIFEARRSRKAIIPKAVLIKAQPRYIAAMPHTPICPPPPRTLPYPRRFYRSFFHNPLRNPFHSGTIVCRDTFPSPITFFRDSFFSLPPPLSSLSLSLSRARAHAIVSDYGRVCVKGATFLNGSASLF